MTQLDDDESLAYEIIKALDWHDLCVPIDGIPKVVELLKKHRKPTPPDIEGELKQGWGGT